MTSKTILVAATANSGKMKEFRALLYPYFAAILSQKEMGVVLDVEETGETFAENALLKAKALSGILGSEYAVIADDSGLCVDALDGAPGIFSARFAGEHGNDRLNNAKLLELMKGKVNRKAKFVSAIALICGNNQIVGIGEIEGQILHSERGLNGFGYDPLFYCYKLAKSFGEADEAEKNLVSHRANAIKEVIKNLDEKR